VAKKKSAAPAENGDALFIDTTDDETAMQVIRASVLGLWDAVDNLSRIRPRRADAYYVTIFGSARIRPNMTQYKEVRRLARELAEMGCRIVTGGGPGLMQAANEGAREANPDDPEASVGVRIDLAHEQQTNAFVGQAYRHRTFFSRLHNFVWMSNAFVVVPGGIGTLLELTMIWQLLQVQKLYNTPLIAVGAMWKDLQVWATEHMTAGRPHLADPVDMTIPVCVETVDEALALVRNHHLFWLHGAPSPPRRPRV
jgi:uncharacterized protein (TIGR00730 family)